MAEGLTRPAVLYQWLMAQVERFGPESTAHCISEEEALALFPTPPPGKKWASALVYSTGSMSVNALLQKMGSEWFCRHIGQDFFFARRRPQRAHLYFLPLADQLAERVIAKVGFTSRAVEVRARELRFDTPVSFELGKVVVVRSIYGFELETFLHKHLERDGCKVLHTNKDGTTATELFSFTQREWNRVQGMDLFDSTLEEAKDALLEMLNEGENVDPVGLTPILTPSKGIDKEDDISALIDKLSFASDENTDE
jgi:hypothetical protein